MADDLNLTTGLAAILDALQKHLATESEALMMLRALIDRETKAPSYVAFQKAYDDYVQRQQEIKTNRSRLIAVDDPAYLLR